MRLSGIKLAYLSAYILNQWSTSNKNLGLGWEGHYNLCCISSDCIHHPLNIDGQNICLDCKFCLVRGIEL